VVGGGGGWGWGGGGGGSQRTPKWKEVLSAYQTYKAPELWNRRSGVLKSLTQEEEKR